jgi:hypothetical protein
MPSGVYKHKSPSIESIKKRVLSRAGYKHSKETIEKIRIANIGKKRTEESKLKMSISKVGLKRKPHSEMTRLKMSNSSIGKKKSPKHIQNIRKAKKLNPTRYWFGKKRLDMTGENNPNWIIDRSKLAKRQERNDTAYKEWRRQVWLRDNFKCKIDNPNCSGRIEAHHILGWMEYPELRYQVNNGITLCHAHHPKRRAEEKRLVSEFQELVSVSKV